MSAIEASGDAKLGGATITLRGWIQRAYIAGLVLTTLAYGSAAPFPMAAASFGFSSLTLFSVFLPIGSVRIRRLHLLSAFVSAALLAYAFAQTWQVGVGSPFAHPAWNALQTHIGGARGSVSVAPGMTLEALPALALPFLVFLSGLSIFQGDVEAARLWRALAGIGLGCAVFGIAQEIFFPDTLIFETKKYYLGSLTASFVNRNTAGTFFGVALLLNLSLFFNELKKIRISSLVSEVSNLDLSWRSANVRVILRLLSSLTTALALFLTQSRGAVGATFVGAVVAVFLSALRRLAADRADFISDVWLRRFTIIGALIAVVGAFALFGERSVYRMQEQGADDGRWCAFASTWEAIRDNWVFGTGFGTFQDVFPMYRHAECAGIFGVWERAHNVYLEGMLGLGLVFPIALFIGLITLVATFVHGMRARHAMRFVPVGGFSILCLVALHSLVDFSLQIPGFNVYFAAAMAAAVTVSTGR